MEDEILEEKNTKRIISCEDQDVIYKRIKELKEEKLKMINHIDDEKGS